MSTDWDVVCDDCGPNDSANRLGLSDFRGWEDLEVLVKHRATLEAMALLVRDTYGCGLQLGFGYHGPHVDPEFFAKHKGHRLRVRSEYGDYSNECSEWYDPADPATRQTVIYGDRHAKCTRPTGHEGEHGRQG